MRQLLLILLVLFSVVPSSRADYNTWTNSCNDGHEPGGSTKQWRTRNTCKTRRTRVCDSVDKWGNRVTCSEETNRNPAEGENSQKAIERHHAHALLRNVAQILTNATALPYHRNLFVIHFSPHHSVRRRLHFAHCYTCGLHVRLHL